MGWPGLPLLTDHKNSRVRGSSRDLLYCGLLQGGESGSHQKFLFITGALLLAPPASGGRLLPGMAWRRRRAGPRSLVAPSWRSGSFAG